MKILKFIIILLLPLLFTMCGQSLSLTGKNINDLTGGGGGNNNNSNSGSNLPTVVSVSPVNDNASVDVASAITATFSVAMDPATINATTFTLQQGTTAVTGTVTYSGTTATFTPTTALSQHSTYIASISTGAKDTSGKALAGNYAWVFTTARNYSAWMDIGIIYEAPLENAYYPCVLYDSNGFGTGSPAYYMWYSDDWFGYTYLVKSSNGLQWGSPVQISNPSDPSDQDHTQVLYDANCFGVSPCIAGVTPKFKMWYWGVTTGAVYTISAISVAESVDGINWTNTTPLTQDPILQLIQNPDTGTGWNRGTYGPSSLHYDPNAPNTGTDPWNYKYVMYYDGTDGSREVTGMAYSTDGINWAAVSPLPVLDGSLVAAWDCNSSIYGTVYKDIAGYHYWYSGAGADDGSGGCAFHAVGNGIGYASSSDGISWVKSTSNPIFDMDDGVSYRVGRVYTPSVVDDGSGVLRMYYSASVSSDPFWGPGVVERIGMAVLH
jgi:hypothetical protein